jgi:hypothetical protein
MVKMGLRFTGMRKTQLRLLEEAEAKMRKGTAS